MASSSFPCSASATPRSFSAKGFREVQSRVWRQRVSLSCAEAGLPPGAAYHQDGNRTGGRRGNNHAADRPEARQASQRPGQHDAQPDLRQVRIAVGHRLGADLHQADHGHQHAQVPQPADDQVRMLRAASRARMVMPPARLRRQ